MFDHVELDPKRRATSDFVEWNPKRHGQKPPYWLPDMLTSVDGKNFARQPNWAWIAGSTYYVPPEAVGVVPEAVEEEQTDELVKRLRDEDEGGWVAGLCNQAADRIEALTAENERLREALREIASDDFGLQGLIEDGVYEETETSRYYAALVSWRRKRALAALEKQP